MQIFGQYPSDRQQIAILREISSTITVYNNINSINSDELKHFNNKI